MGPPPPPPRRPATSNPAFGYNNYNNQFNDSSYPSDYDPNWPGSDFLPFASPELINSVILHRGGNVRSEYQSQFGSRIRNVNHVPTPAEQQETFLPHHGTRRSLQFRHASSPYIESTQTPMLTTHNNRSNFHGPSYDNNTNIRASWSSFTQSNLGTNCSMNQMAANNIQMNRVSQERKPIHERNNDLLNLETGSSFAVAGETCPLPNNYYSESQSLVLASSSASHAIDNLEHISGFMQVSPSEQQIVSCDGDMAPLQDTNGVENPGSPRSERQMTSEKDGSNKGCSCKKSQCLKLYCVCFASLQHCLSSCTCEGCLNTNDNVSKVQNARKKVESRNPLAFAPKVIHEGAKSPADSMEDGTPSSSARHRTGCNCKGSKCLKKYCECFKGNAGCSYDCRCTNCENSFGRRPVMYNTARNGDNPSNASTVSTREIHSNCNNGNDNTLESSSGASSPNPVPEAHTRTSSSFPPHAL